MKELNLRFEFNLKPEATTNASVSNHVHILQAIKMAFPTSVRIMDNKNNKLKNIDSNTLTNVTDYHDHFIVHHHPGNKFWKSKMVIVHRIYSKVSLSTIKNDYCVQPLLKLYDVFICPHSWPEDVWDITTLGFIVGDNPISLSPGDSEDILIASANEQNIPLDPKTFRHSFASPSIVQDGIRYSTKGYEIQCRRSNSRDLNRTLKKIFKDHPNYASYSLKRTHPKLFLQMIRKQNRYLASIRTVPIVGIDRECMFYLQDHLVAIENVTFVLEINKTDTIGCWNVITDVDHFIQVKQDVVKVLTETDVPIDAKAGIPPSFPPVQIPTRVMSDSSSIDSAYLSMCEKSLGSVDSLDDSDTDKGVSQSSIPSTLTWAQIAFSTPDPSPSPSQTLTPSAKTQILDVTTLSQASQIPPNIAKQLAAQRHQLNEQHKIMKLQKQSLDEHHDELAVHKQLVSNMRKELAMISGLLRNGHYSTSRSSSPSLPSSKLSIYHLVGLAAP